MLDLLVEMAAATRETSSRRVCGTLHEHMNTEASRFFSSAMEWSSYDFNDWWQTRVMIGWPLLYMYSIMCAPVDRDAFSTSGESTVKELEKSRLSPMNDET